MMFFSIIRYPDQFSYISTNSKKLLKHSYPQHVLLWYCWIVGQLYYWIYWVYMLMQSTKRPKLFWISAMAPLTSVILGSILVYFTHAEKHGVQVVTISLPTRRVCLSYQSFTFPFLLQVNFIFTTDNWLYYFSFIKLSLTLK